MKPELLERTALFASVVSGVVAATAGWLGQGMLALIAGLAAATLPFVQSYASNRVLGHKFARRSLSGESILRMANEMANHAMLALNEPRRVAIFPTSEHFEPSAFADQLAQVFAAAGWNVNRNSVHYGRPMHVSGVGILAHTNPGSEAAAELVVTALRQFGIDSFVIPERVPLYGQEPNLDPTDPFHSSISIMVGDKP